MADGGMGFITVLLEPPVALLTLSGGSQFLADRAFTEMGRSIRKAGTGPLLGSVITTVGPVWTPVETCNTEDSFVLSAFRQSPILSQRTDILTE